MILHNTKITIDDDELKVVMFDVLAFFFDSCML